MYPKVLKYFLVPQSNIQCAETLIIWKVNNLHFEEYYYTLLVDKKKCAVTKIWANNLDCLIYDFCMTIGNNYTENINKIMRINIVNFIKSEKS